MSEEKRKMIAGELYLSGRPNASRRSPARQNSCCTVIIIPPRMTQEQRQHILAELFARAGDAYIEPSFRLRLWL
ncbi:maltose O-acetyltransferase [Klebsiella pneumoniae]|nr:maltose O-acetyltransferase [Klebsiella pneumoniae]